MMAAMHRGVGLLGLLTGLVLAACGSSQNESSPGAGGDAAVDSALDTGPDSEPDGGGPGPLPAEPGRHDLSFEVDGVTRWLIYYVPKGYSASKAAPMVVAFHGGNGGMQNMFETRGDMLTEAEAKTFIVVFPNGQNKDDNKGSSVWNAGYCCAAAYAGQAKNDVAFAEAIVERLSAGLSVDAKRVHAMGFSNGGILIHKIASERPTLFASAVTMSCAIGGKANPTAPLEVPTATGPFTIAHIHGKADTNVKYAGGVSDSNPERTDLAFTDTVGHWVKASKCNPTPTTQTANGAKGKIFIDTYGGCADGKEVRGVSVEGHQHSWADVDSAGFNGTAQGVDFLLAHPAG